MTYKAPVKDILFALETVDKDFSDKDLAEGILAEASKLAEDIWVPTDSEGDMLGARLENGEVKVPNSFVSAYQQFIQSGWQSITASEEFGGQNLRRALAMAVNEVFQSSNMALSICPLLSQATIELLEKYGSPHQKAQYLPKLISGEWTSTMQLSETTAGSDLSSVKTTALKDGDKYLIKGQKIFISWGDNNLSENILHVVLADIERTEVSRGGFGLFLVPKYIDGKINNVEVRGLEHKMGINGSPTCVMNYDNSIGYLVGQEGRALRSMFSMMNNARITVALQGVAVSERSYQHALQYAKNRIQGKKWGDVADRRVSIIEHQDVRRMLLKMKASIEATRALTYYAGNSIDKGNEDLVAFLTPLAKAWVTDSAVENTSLGIQVHGGVGYMQECPASQFFRDARVLPIYEGTNGIQAVDFIFRKVLKDSGAKAIDIIQEIKMFVATIPDNSNADLATIRAICADAIDELEEVTLWLIANDKETEVLASIAYPYLEFFAITIGGYMMAKQAMLAYEKIKSGDDDRDYLEAKIITARFYCDTTLIKSSGLAMAIVNGYYAVTKINDDQF